jgi:hypothetical protein
MKNQLFKEKIPNETLFNLIEQLAIKTDDYYIIDNNAYKKGIFNNSIIFFLEECKKYYYNSKKIYIERKMNYNCFITIIRQICKYNGIKYISKIKYDQSKYEIVYHIYYLKEGC